MVVATATAILCYEREFWMCRTHPKRDSKGFCDGLEAKRTNPSKRHTIPVGKEIPVLEPVLI